MFTYRSNLKLLTDIVLWTFVTVLAYLLRFDISLGDWVQQILFMLPFLVIAKSGMVMVFGSYRQSWRNTGFVDLFLVSKMVLSYTLVMFIAIVSLRLVSDSSTFLASISIPLAIPAMELMIGVPILLLPRILTRFFLIYRLPESQYTNYGIEKEIHRVLIVGAGESGAMVAREMQKHPQKGMIPVAFVDDDVSLLKQKIHGIKVVGTVKTIPMTVDREKITKVIIAMPSADGGQIRRVIGRCQMTKAEYQIVPAIYDLLSGDVSNSQIRDVDVEDLLRRKPVKLDTSDIQAYLNGQTVLVTGAGGSIGSEIVRQISRFSPSKVVLVGRGENSIHLLVREIGDVLPSLPIVTRIADVRDKDTLEQIFEQEKPAVVFHAAAHKHVPLMEENPAQAIFNNVMGTQHLVNTAMDFGVKFFINISTDKAVNPTSVMGASKRIAEQIVEHASARVNNGAVFVSVRFGNVLGSRGSVVPIFKDQIRRGGPITVTHPDMIRYFMTIPEASQLVLQAGALKMNGAVFVLDMGEPVNIEQMARDLIRLSGLEPDVDIAIKYSGIRPGEKMFEELLTAEEGTTLSHHEKIFVAHKSEQHDELEQDLELLVLAAKSGNGEQIRREIKRLVPSYQIEVESSSVI